MTVEDLVEVSTSANTNPNGSEIDSSLLSSITGFLIERVESNPPHVDNFSQEQNSTATSENDEIVVEVDTLAKNDLHNITNSVAEDTYEKEEKYEDDPPYWDSRESLDHTISGIDSVVILDNEQEDDDSQKIDEDEVVPLLGKRALRRRRAKRNRM